MGVSEILEKMHVILSFFWITTLLLLFGVPYIVMNTLKYVKGTKPVTFNDKEVTGKRRTAVLTFAVSASLILSFWLLSFLFMAVRLTIKSVP